MNNEVFYQIDFMKFFLKHIELICFNFFLIYLYILSNFYCKINKSHKIYLYIKF
jgi:hypothetical protein